MSTINRLYFESTQNCLPDKRKSREEARKCRELCPNPESKNTSAPTPTCPNQRGQQQQQQQQSGLHQASHGARLRGRHNAIVCPSPSVMSQHHTS